MHCELNLGLHRHLGHQRGLGAVRRGRGVRSRSCFRAAACCSHCRIRIPPEFGKQRHAACTRQPGHGPKGRFKPPPARQLASTRQLSFLSEWRSWSTFLKTRARGCHELSHEVQPQRPTTPGSAPTRCTDPGPLRSCQRVVFLSGLSATGLLFARERCG